MKKCQPVTLTPYLDGELNDDMRREIDQHLQSCASCGTLLEQLSDANRQVGSMGRAVIPVTALRPALDIFIERAGLTPGSAMRHTNEVVRPGPVVEALEPEADLVPVRQRDSTPEIVSETPSDGKESPDQDDGLRDAWSAGLPAMAPPAATGILDDEFWGKKSADQATPAELQPEQAADPGGAQAPTWVEPEPWVPASHHEELQAPEAPGVAASEVDDGRVDSELSTSGAEELETADAAPAVERERDLPGVVPKSAAPAERLEALEEHPTPPPPEIRPPWMDASPGDDDDLEEAGRRAVDEAIGPDHESLEPSGIASVPAAADAAGDESDEGQEPPRGWFASLFDNRRQEPPTPEGDQAPAHDADGPSERNVAASTAELAIAKPATDETQPATLDATDDADEDRGFRRGLAWAQDEPSPPGRGLGSLSTQLKIGLLGGLGIVIVLVALLLITQGPSPSPTASTTAKLGAAAHPSAAATPARGAAPSPVPSATSVAPTTAQLTEVVTAGAGGSGWRVVGIRIGSPGTVSGITRVVLDLDGPGAQPDAQLGRGSDGGVYLTAAGIAIAPETVTGFSGRDAISGITQTGTQGLALRLATNGSPGFAIGYLSVPNRLVLDFK